MTYLKYFLVLVAVSILGTGCGAKNSAEVVRNEATSTLPVGQIFNLHFVGGNTASTDTGATFLKDVFAMPESQAFKEEILTKLSRLPIELIRRHGRDNNNDCAALIRPLLDDLTSAESLVTVRVETNQTPDMVLAVRLTEARARLWQTNVMEALELWTNMRVTGIADGWELKKHHAPDLIRFVRVGDWVILGAGQEKIGLADEWVARVKTDGRPCPVARDYWLSAECDWSRLSKYVPTPGGVDLLHISGWQMTLSGRQDNYLGTRIVVKSDEAFNWQSEAWRIPTNIVHGTPISFTAAQGIRGLLGKQTVKVEPMAGQFYSWALPDIQLQTYLAVTTDNASNSLEQLAPQLLSLNPKISRNGLGQIEWKPDHKALLWGGIPFFLAPFIETVHEPGGDYLFAGVFPNSPRRAAFPPELLAQIIGRTNLLYYDWEITSERLSSLRYLTQLALLLSNREQLDGESPAGKWINAIYPKLGDCITEATLTQPNELTLLRKSQIGLSSLELLALANWVESPDFPLAGLVRPIKQTKSLPRRKPPAPTMP